MPRLSEIDNGLASDPFTVVFRRSNRKFGERSVGPSGTGGGGGKRPTALLETNIIL